MQYAQTPAPVVIAKKDVGTSKTAPGASRKDRVVKWWSANKSKRFAFSAVPPPSDRFVCGCEGCQAAKAGPPLPPPTGPDKGAEHIALTVYQGRQRSRPGSAADGISVFLNGKAVPGRAAPGRIFSFNGIAAEADGLVVFSARAGDVAEVRSGRLGTLRIIVRRGN